MAQHVTRSEIATHQLVHGKRCHAITTQRGSWTYSATGLKNAMGDAGMEASFPWLRDLVLAEAARRVPLTTEKIKNALLKQVARDLLQQHARLRDAQGTPLIATEQGFRAVHDPDLRAAMQNSGLAADVQATRRSVIKLAESFNDADPETYDQGELEQAARAYRTQQIGKLIGIANTPLGPKYYEHEQLKSAMLRAGLRVHNAEAKRTVLDEAAAMAAPDADTCTADLLKEAAIAVYETHGLLRRPGASPPPPGPSSDFTYMPKVSGRERAFFGHLPHNMPSMLHGLYGVVGGKKNREHVWPQSHDGPNDPHNLYWSSPYSNSVRGNLPHGEVVQEDWSWAGAKRGLDSEGRLVFEPPEHSKGNVARTLRYVAKRYDFEIPAWQKPMLDRWALIDPVDEAETFRNKELTRQGGQNNPFVG